MNSLRHAVSGKACEACFTCCVMRHRSSVALAKKTRAVSVTASWSHLLHAVYDTAIAAAVSWGFGGVGWGRAKVCVCVWGGGGGGGVAGTSSLSVISVTPPADSIGH